MYLNHSNCKPDVNRSHRCIDMSCHVQGCDFTSTIFSNLCEHLKWHIRDGKKIQCTFENCKKNFRVRSFLSHVSRKHSADQVVSAGGVSTDDTPNAADKDDGGTHSAEIAETGKSSSNKVDGDVFMTNLALFYLRMQAKMLLPATTISALTAEFQELHTNWIKHVLTVVSQELKKT